jgi:hypothetical protein
MSDPDPTHQTERFLPCHCILCGTTYYMSEAMLIENPDRGRDCCRCLDGVYQADKPFDWWAREVPYVMKTLYRRK